ncbi:DUF805 domain-containing protein [Litorimonas sp. RW-G-Af-16]|uniref:DUF805 domain-containing protein n=1 Tax=Litorimonas sp. RW-G-Af-16 TaxID=3241168 RepID=UPI00390C7C77
MIKLFLSPAGRMGRKKFWIGFVGFAVFVTLAQLGLHEIADTLAGFFLSLIFIVLVFQILYSVYGKRLHDMGRSFWPLTAMLALTVVIAIAVLMAYGGSEYFSEFAKYDRKDDIDPAEIARLQANYQARLADGGVVLGPLLYGVWGLFTAWCGFAKPDPEANRYGAPLG